MLCSFSNLTNLWQKQTQRILETMPKYGSECNKNPQAIQDSGNILYDAIKPLFILTQWFGLFLVTNLESSKNMKPSALLSFLRIPGLIIIGYQVHYIFNTFSSVFHVLRHYGSHEKMPYLTITMILYDRLNGLIILFYLIIKSKEFPLYFSNWKPLNPMLQEVKGSLQRLSITAITVSLLLTLTQTFLVAEFQEKVSSTYMAIYLSTCFLLNYAVLFIQACFLIFAKALFIGFKAVTREMEELFLDQYGTGATFDKNHFSKRLLKIRQNHQHLCNLTKQTTDLLHPALFIVIVSIVISQLAAFYGLYYTIIRQSNTFYLALLALLLYVVVIRIIPLAGMCHLGENVRTQVRNCIYMLINFAELRVCLPKLSRE